MNPQARSEKSEDLFDNAFCIVPEKVRFWTTISRPLELRQFENGIDVIWMLLKKLFVKK